MIYRKIQLTIQKFRELEPTQTFDVYNPRAVIRCECKLFVDKLISGSIFCGSLKNEMNEVS